MRRVLADGNTGDPLAAWFQLLQTSRRDPFRKRRIWIRLQRRRRTGFFFRLRALLPPLLFVSGATAAELGRRYVVEHRAAHGAVKAQDLGDSDNHSSRADTKICASPAPSDAPETQNETGIAIFDSNGRSAVQLEHSRVGSSDDPAMVLDAIHALRIDGDPIRARALLAGYLQAHPHGVFVSDALALTIEAAWVQKDPRAIELARRYLQEFPHGKYRSLAVRILEHG